MQQNMTASTKIVLLLNILILTPQFSESDKVPYNYKSTCVASNLYLQLSSQIKTQHWVTTQCKNPKRISKLLKELSLKNMIFKSISSEMHFSHLCCSHFISPKTTSHILKPLYTYSGTFSQSAKTKFGSSFVMFLSSATAFFKWESAERDLLFYLCLMTTR